MLIGLGLANLLQLVVLCKGEVQDKRLDRIIASASDLANYVGRIVQLDFLIIFNHVNFVNPNQTAEVW